jgi:hypothetical protein
MSNVSFQLAPSQAIAHAISKYFQQPAEKYYVFKVLPFGLATACFVFTKVMRQFTKRWRGMGIRVVVYIDDGLVLAHSYEGAQRAAAIVKSDLESAGWVLNVQKTRLTPFRVGIWLGWLLDLAVGWLAVPEERIQKLIASISKLSACSLLRLARTRYCPT